MTQLIAHLFGDYITQSDWMAQNKTKASWPCFLHCLLYSLCFAWLCWVPMHVNQQPAVCVTIVDSYGDESQCVSPGSQVPVGAGYRVYTNDTTTIIPAHFRWLPWLVIFGSHFLIDRFRLARYVVWVKNLIGPWSRLETVAEAVARMRSSGMVPYPGLPERPGEFHPIELRRINLIAPLSECPTGYPPSTPIWLATILLIVADNAIHLLVNYCALRWL